MNELGDLNEFKEKSDKIINKIKAFIKCGKKIYRIIF